MWRVRDRRTFVDLRRRGRRARHGSVSVTYLAPPPSSAPAPPRVAFAVPRKVGPAVVRNRLRRRIRAHLAVRADNLASGAYLVGLAPTAGEAGRDTLLSDVDRCLERLEVVAR